MFFFKLHLTLTGRTISNSNSIFFWNVVVFFFSYLSFNDVDIIENHLHPIVCIGVSTSPQKHHPLFLAKPPPLNLQTVQAPLFKQPPYILVFGKIPPLKLGFFHELQEY